MPPPRRHTRTTPPPPRRPRVAGSRRPGPAKPAPEPAELDSFEPEVAEPETVEAFEDPTFAAEPPRWTEPDDVEDTDTKVIAPAVIDGSTDTQEAEETAETDGAQVPSPTPRTRPAGKRRSLGIAAPKDLAEAEAEIAAAKRPARPRRDLTLTWTIVTAVVAVILAGLAVWFRGEASSASDNADTNNKALIDPATQSEVVQQVRTAIEKSLTYNYTDLDSTAKAVQDNLSGKALCEYDQLFGEVKKLAPEQKIVLTTQVRDIGVTRLEGSQALLLVFVDQQTTRADQNQTTASGAQFNVKAEKQGNRWKITDFDMLGQPLPNGKPNPQC